ncbi:hypothetical protein [Streptomyces sp. NPDC048565]|uniref:hypothetical protein n=1 Tax=Streptomyces sp. NPDC048565 TaxID=3155266 RepID=UPI0034204708
MTAEGRRDEEHSRWSMHAQAAGKGRVYQAGGDQHVTVHVHRVQPKPLSAGSLRNALAPLYVLLQLVGTIAFVVGGLIASKTLGKAPFSTLALQSCGIMVASLALMMLVERLFTGRWHRWSRTRRRAPRL